MTWVNLASKTLGLSLLLPLILTSYNETDIILWYVFATLFSVGLLFDLGFTPTFIRFFSYAKVGASVSNLLMIQDISKLPKRLESLNAETFREVLILTNRNYFYLGIVCFVSLLLAGTASVKAPITNSSSPLESWVAWFVLILSTSCIIYGNKYVAVLHGLHKIAESQRVMALSSVLATVLSSILILAGAELYIVIIAYNLVSASSVLFNWHLTNLLLKANKLLPEGDEATIGPNDKLSKLIFGAAWKSALGVLMSVGIIQFSGLAAANFLSASDAAMYLLSLQLIKAISSFSQAPFYTKIPNFAGYFATGNSKALKSLSFKAQLQSLAFFCLVSSFLLLSFPFIEMFTNFNAQLPSPSLWVLMAGGILIERAGAMQLQLYSLTNNIIWHYLNGITGVAMVVLSLLFYSYLGVLSFPLALFISYLAIYYPLSSYYASGIVGKSYCKKQALILVLFISILIFMLLLRRMF